MSNKVFYSYDDIADLVITKIEQIKYNNFDCIIAIGSGGLIPAVIIKNILNIPLYVINISSYNNHIKGDIKVNQWLDHDFKDKHVLLVDEIDDTGSTLTFCTNKLRQDNNCYDLSIFVIHNRVHNKCSNYINHEPYHYCELIETDDWINYPWKK